MKANIKGTHIATGASKAYTANEVKAIKSHPTLSKKYKFEEAIPEPEEPKKKATKQEQEEK